MKLEIEGLTRAEELAWLFKVPWTITSTTTTEDDDITVRVQEIPDAIAVGTEKEVGREIWESLRASLECRLDHNDPIPLPHCFVAPPLQPVVFMGSKSHIFGVVGFR